jgi:hypothetical protein
LQANEFRQINSLLRSVGLSDTYNARVSVRVIEGEGKVTAYASVIDMLTNDPTYAPAQLERRVEPLCNVAFLLRGRLPVRGIMKLTSSMTS